MRRQVWDMLCSNEDIDGLAPVERILELGVLEQEKQELCQLVVRAAGEEAGKEANEATWTVLGNAILVMAFAPEPIYRDPLVRLLDAEFWWSAVLAARALLRGRYDGALGLVMESSDRLAKVGDRIIGDLLELQHGGAFDRFQQQRLQEAFCRRFVKLPPRDGWVERWFDLVAFLTENMEEVSATLTQCWEQVDPEDRWYPRDIMFAISRHPHEMHRGLLKAARKNRNSDVRWLAREGLKKLDGVE